MENNKDLRTEHVSTYFVIVADRDGVRKYISNNFPRLFPYTIKLNNAKRFYAEDKAQDFIDGFNDYGNKYMIKNSEIRIVEKRLTLI